VSDYLPFIVIGLATGAIYGLAGTGLVLTYKTSGIFNFAYGSVAALAAFLFYFLRQQHHIPWPFAALLCCGVFAPILGLLLERLARSLGHAATTIKVLCTIGIILTVLAIGTLWYPTPVLVDSFLPTSSVLLGGVYVGWDQITIFAFALLATGLLYWFFRSSRMGIAMRGVVDNPDLLARTGENPDRVRRWAWVIGTIFASIAGILIVPSIDLDALFLTLLVVQAFGAAAIGSFSNLPMTFVGGLLIGIGGSLATKFSVSYPSLSGLSTGLPFIILFVVLVATPRARLAVRSLKPIIEVHRSWVAPTSVRLGSSSIILAVLAFVPVFAGVHLIAYSELLVTFILLLSLGLLVKTSGQVSLCHYAFAAVGAVGMVHFAGSFGLPWLVALLLSALVTVPIGAFVALPAIRLSGVFLALATFGFGVLLEQMFYGMNFMFGTNIAGTPVPRPGGAIGSWTFGSDSGFYYVLLLLAVASAIAIVLVERGRLGRLLRAMRDAPTALQTLGASLPTTRVLAFCISAFFAGLAGALLASLFQFAASTQYSSFSSLTLFAVVVIVIMGEPWYALMGAAFVVLVPSYWNSANVSTYLELLFGLSAVTYVFWSKRPLSVPHRVRQVLEKLAYKKRTSRQAPRLRIQQADGKSPAGSMRSGLEIKNLTIRYGGVTAVSDVTLTAPLGVITGLIGPNGAGKSTTLNACSGLVRPSSGVVLLDGRALSRVGPARRARRGLGRTFQRVELFDSLTVEENVAMGREAGLAGGSPASQLRAKRRDVRDVQTALDEAIALVGLDTIRTKQTGLLPTGQRRLVELARTLAGSFEMLLLDEPSSGLDHTESAHFGDILRAVVNERGVGVLLVEHDMALVRQVCNQIYVLDFGIQIFEGSVEQMRSSKIVQAAYLGNDARDEMIED
jgi:ABC-type branched-subunit amino acid transport system ATPase component/branched-subunit amino acid ABC-type transport system permease component